MQAQCLLWENAKLCVHAKFLRRTKSCKQSFLWGNAKLYLCKCNLSCGYAKLLPAIKVSRRNVKCLTANKLSPLVTAEGKQDPYAAVFIQKLTKLQNRNTTTNLTRHRADNELKQPQDLNRQDKQRENL